MCFKQRLRQYCNWCYRNNDIFFTMSRFVGNCSNFHHRLAYIVFFTIFVVIQSVQYSPYLFSTYTVTEHKLSFGKTNPGCNRNVYSIEVKSFAFSSIVNYFGTFLFNYVFEKSKISRQDLFSKKKQLRLYVNSDYTQIRLEKNNR